MQARDGSDSIHERRRKAPFHFFAKADNARFVAYALSHGFSDVADAIAEATFYGGAPAIALHEAFCREAAFALESIIKAVIAQRLSWGLSTTMPRATHALDALWIDAGLGNLSRERMYWLLRAKQILFWAGRYAAPMRDRDFEMERRELARYTTHERIGSMRIERRKASGWENFRDLYDEAAGEFWIIQEKMSP